MELAWRTRPDDGSKTERRYLDFIVDGESLQDLLHADDGPFLFDRERYWRVFSERLGPL